MFHAPPTVRFLFLRILSVAWLAWAACPCDAAAPVQRADGDLARSILEATGLTGGLIVHVGCGDGQLTAALGAGRRFVIQGLDTDADQVRQARASLRKLGIYGRVSVEPFDGKRLPYADNLVNLIVADDLAGVPAEEAMRVLAPGGSLYRKQHGRWTRVVKPRPGNIDEWTHFLHDASGNAVAHDDVVGPPGRLQWTARPPYTRSHEHIPSLCALVSAGGRIFYIVDEGPTASIKQPPHWYLVARDAFNGILLWKKPISTWFPHLVNWGQTPRQLERRLVAVGDRVYVTLGLHAPLSAVDAATGDTLKVYENTRGTEEIVWHKGTLLLAARGVTAARIAELEKWPRLVTMKNSPLDQRESAEPLVRRLRATESSGEKAVLALEADTGRLLWKKTGADVSGLKTGTLCADSGRVFYQAGRDVVCRDLNSGEALWSAPCPPLRLVCDGSVYSADGKTVTALSAQTGKTRWADAASLCEVRDVFVAGGSLWVGGFQPWQGRTSGKRGPAWGPYFVTQRDPATGKILMRVEPENPGHHHRCYRNKATDRYILGGRRGTEFIDLASGDVLWNSWARGVCKYGVMPSNGLLYAPPHACACYVGAKLIGFNALAPLNPTRPAPTEPAPGLEPGPAYDAPIAASGSPRSDGWPTYRHDAQRSGCTHAAVPAMLRERWRADLGGRLTSPTVSGGKVFVALPDEHRVSAVDAGSGEPAWRFTAGARVDSPPTVYRDRAIFGCRDGCVYSVRTSDGALAWRLRTAHAGRRVVVDGQLESVAPVPGSVLVEDGAACFTAGRSSYLDGGIDLYRLDPRTGKTLSTTIVYSPDPKTGRQPHQFAPSAMPGARWDILSSDGRCVYLRDMAFDKQGNPQPEGPPHLFTLTGFLDDAWAHRSYWIFGTHCSISTGCSHRDNDLVYGRLLVVDGSTVFGYGRQTVHWSNQLQDGAYRLFALKRGAEEPLWEKPVPVHVRAMLLAGDVLFLAGSPAGASAGASGGFGGHDQSRQGLLAALSASEGTVLAQYPLACPPVFDGMAAADARLYVSLENGQLVSMEGK